jgi:hypothetical protein
MSTYLGYLKHLASISYPSGLTETICKFSI